MALPMGSNCYLHPCTFQGMGFVNFHDDSTAQAALGESGSLTV